MEYLFSLEEIDTLRNKIHSYIFQYKNYYYGKNLPPRHYIYSVCKKYISHSIVINSRYKFDLKNRLTTNKIFSENKMVIDRLIDAETKLALENSKQSIGQLKECMDNMSSCNKEASSINDECEKIMAALENIDTFIQTGTWESK